MPGREVPHPGQEEWSQTQKVGRKGCEEGGEELNSRKDQVKAQQKSVHVFWCLSVCDLHRSKG